MGRGTSRYFLPNILANPPGVLLDVDDDEPPLEHLQRSWSGTPAKACSMCIPHPAHVALTKGHIAVVSFGQKNKKKGTINFFWRLTFHT
jgi:hypothetical protein